MVTPAEPTLPTLWPPAGGIRPVVVIGASGNVGGSILEALRRHGPATGTRHRSTAPSLVQLDALDPRTTRELLACLRPRAVVIAAGLTDVDRCELQPSESYRANVLLARVVAEASADLGVHVVYLSSDYVFDGTSGPYTETAALSPVNVYGRHKAHGERTVLDKGGFAAVVRTSVVYGGHRPGAVERLLAALRAGEPVRLSDRHHNTPTAAADVARVVCDVIDAGATGTFHAAGPQTMSRLDFGRTVARVFGIDEARVQPAPAGGAQAAARRPERCGLLIARAVREFGYQPRPLAVGLGS